LELFLDKLDLKGDAERLHELFERLCLKLQLSEGIGANVLPVVSRIVQGQ
jgi:hypothetical protein